MHKVERRILSLAAPFAAAALLAMSGGLAAQGGEPETPPPAEEQGEAAAKSPESRPAAPAQRAVPHVTGTVARWNGSRFDLQLPDGKTEQVAVNRDTKVLAKIEAGARVSVEYRRKVSGFVIAERVLPAEEAAPEAPPAAAAAPAQSPGSPAITGSVVTWNDAALIVRTEAGEVTFFLSPETEYLVKSLDAGLQVVVEYQEEGAAKLATRVRAAQAKEKETPARKGDSGL